MSDKEKKTVIREFCFIYINVMQFSIKAKENSSRLIIHPGWLCYCPCCWILWFSTDIRGMPHTSLDPFSLVKSKFPTGEAWRGEIFLGCCVWVFPSLKFSHRKTLLLPHSEYCLFMSPCDRQVNCPGCTHPRTMIPGIGYGAPLTLKRIKQ